MKRVMLIVLMAAFSTVMFAQTQSETKPPAEKKKTQGTEVKTTTMQAKPVSQPAGTKEQTQPGTVKKEEPKSTAKKSDSKHSGKKKGSKPAEPKTEPAPKK